MPNQPAGHAHQLHKNRCTGACVGSQLCFGTFTLLCAVASLSAIKREGGYTARSFFTQRSHLRLIGMLLLHLQAHIAGTTGTPAGGACVCSCAFLDLVVVQSKTRTIVTAAARADCTLLRARACHIPPAGTPTRSPSRARATAPAPSRRGSRTTTAPQANKSDYLKVVPS